MQEAEYRDSLILQEIYQYCLYVQELLEEFGIDENLFYTKRALSRFCQYECPLYRRMRRKAIREL